jgi:hypothetical protein
MFCPSCGQKNDEDSGFCGYCGAELIDNQPDVLSEPNLGEVFSNLKQIPARIKHLPKAAKQISIIVLAVLIVFILFNSIGSAVTNPQGIVKRYFEAEIRGDWSKIYSLLALDNTEFINRKNFIVLMETLQDQNLDIVNYTLSENTTGRGSSLMGTSAPDPSVELVRTYTITYVLKDSSQKHTETVTLVKNSKKLLLLFDSYDLVIDGLLVSDFSILAPVGASVSLNGVPIDSGENTKASSSSDSNLPAYPVPKIFAGIHKLKVETPITEPYEDEITIKSDSSVRASSLELKHSIKSDIAQRTEEDIKKIWAAALAGNSFDSMIISVIGDENYSSDIKQQYDYFVSSVRLKDGVGYKSLSITSTDDASDQVLIDDSGIYTCNIHINYDYTRAEKGWFGDITENTGSKDGYAKFTYKYEDGTWALQRIDNFGIDY